MKRKSSIIMLGLIGTMCTFGLSGCSEKFPVKIGNIKSRQVDKIINLGTNQITGKKININGIDFSSKIQSLSHLGKYRLYGKCPIRDALGIYVKKQKDGYLIEYIRGEHHCSGANFDTKVSYLLKSKANTQKIRFSYPETYKLEASTDAIGIKIKQYKNMPTLEKDIGIIYQKLDKLTLNKVYKFKGEINTNYPDKSIYANFKRLLGQYYRGNERISETLKQNTFLLHINGIRYPLYVEVVPYRNGSKVTYSTTLRYTMGLDGTTSLSKSEIEQLHQKIKSIINN